MEAKLLNPNPRALDFINNLSVSTGRNATFGNVNSFKSERIRNIITPVHAQISASVDVVKKLAKDESRTEVSKHARAKREAETLNATLMQARDALRNEAAKIEADAMARIDAKFTLDPSRAVWQSRKIDWLKEQWQDPAKGTVTINKQIRADAELASLLNSGQGYVLGIPDESRLSFVATAVKAHLPDAHADIETAKQCRDTADKYDPAMAGVRSSFYIESVAAKIETRVE